MTKVLMIDDDNDIRKIGRLSLEAIGKFEVVLAADAQEGLALARRGRPDVILLDMMMPGMDGAATLEALKADPELRAIPVIFMTAKVQRAEVDEYLRRGAIGVIQKPFDPMTLPTEIAKLLAGNSR